MNHAVNHVLAIPGYHMTNQQGFYVVVAIVIVGAVLFVSGMVRKSSGKGGLSMPVVGLVLVGIVILLSHLHK